MLLLIDDNDDDDGVSALVAGGCWIRTARTYSTYGTVPEKIQCTYTFTITTILYGTGMVRSSSYESSQTNILCIVVSAFPHLKDE